MDHSADVSPRLVVTAEAEDGNFDKVTIDNWKAEGFDVTYLPLSTINTQVKCQKTLQGLSDPLSPGKKYAMIGPPSFVFVENQADKPFLCSIWKSRVCDTRDSLEVS